MAYDEQLANRIRESLSHVNQMDEIAMFGGLCFMVNNKMCSGVMKDEMMCRIDPAMRDKLLERPGCRPMNFTGKEMRSIVLIDESGMKNKKDFEYWINLCLDYNPKAKTSKKKK